MASHVILSPVIQLKRLSALATAAQLVEFFVCLEADAEPVGVRKGVWNTGFHFYIVSLCMRDVGELGGIVMEGQGNESRAPTLAGEEDIEG